METTTAAVQNLETSAEQDKAAEDTASLAGPDVVAQEDVQADDESENADNATPAESTVTEEITGEGSSPAENLEAADDSQVVLEDPAAQGPADESGADTAADSASEAPCAEENPAVEADDTPAVQSQAEDKAPAAAAAVKSATLEKSAATIANTTVKKQAASAKKVAKKVSAGSFLINNAVYQIASALSKKYCVSVVDASGAKKTNVALAKKKSLLMQFWRAIDRGNGVYRFKNYAGGYYLAVKGKVKQRANVYVTKSGIIDWKVVKNSDGTFSLKPVSKTKGYLSVANAKARVGANVQLWPSISNKGQKFTFAYNKRLTKAFTVGKTAQPGVVSVSPAGSSIFVDIAGSSSSNNAKAKTAKRTDASSQVFQLRYHGNGLYEFQNANSYMSLSIYGKSKKVGASVVQADRTHGLEQMWVLQKQDTGYKVVSALSGLVLDIDGAKSVKDKGLLLSKGSTSASQIYDFTEAQLVKDGEYVIQSAMSLPFVVSIKDDSKAKKNVRLSRSAGVTGERFTFKYLGNGMYRINSASGKKSIAVDGGSKKNAANVLMLNAKDNDSQKWKLEIGDEGIKFQSVVSGKYLTISTKQAKTGANLDQRTVNGASGQCWKLVDPSWTYYAGASSSAMKLIKKAESYEGWRYQWGGRSPSTSFDCAGLVMYCSNQVWKTHFDLMNTNAEMLYGKCKHIKANEAKPGDLVFYRGTYGSDVSYISHVVIYTGKGYMYGAGDPIGYAKVNSIKNIKGKNATAVFARIRH
ncbi:MAG: RICIN domain-containing protein [Coriobacteriia bacterium]|nr:RICIN domain-containing protein [Coriobacteriia bacterium]